jgi:hypothetical protein
MEVESSPAEKFKTVYFTDIVAILVEIRVSSDLLCALVVRVPGYRSRCPGSIIGATRFSKK